MKKNICFFALLFGMFCNNASAIWTNKTIVFGGLTRSYRVYQSPNYNSSNPASLLIALHGLGDNMTNFSTIGFNFIADTANIICVFPQAVADPYAGTAWNSGAGYMGYYYPNSGINDIGFINALIDTAIGTYSINQSKIYLCGFSMGGFMTERMALQSNTRIAAFGSMSGTIGSGITTYNPGRHVPIAHFHGTADSTVFYTGNSYGIDPDSLINYWVSNNGCNNVPNIFSYPNIVNDNITVERFEYSNGDEQSDVWFYKMTGASHTLLYQPNNDITEIIELWYFFNRHTLASSNVNDFTELIETTQLFPNPTNDKITLYTNDNILNSFVTIFDANGKLVFQKQIENKSFIDVSNLENGVYFVKISNNKSIEVKKFVKN